MTVAIYARVSDDKLTTEGLRRQDVGRQVEQLAKYCGNMGWGEPIIFKDDAASAFKEDYQSRPEFCRLLREVRARRINRVLVESLDRWSRRIEDGLKTMREATQNNCTVTSIAEGECDITVPEGWFKVGVAFLLAEWSSRSMSFKVKKGMERRANNQEKVCSFCKVIHMGRHPLTCGCEACKERVGKKKRSEIDKARYVELKAGIS
jgi:DNA invertase Pin-like site-specific DNA recombinase